MQFKIFKGKNIVQGISESKFGSMVGKRGDENAIKFLKSLGYKNPVRPRPFSQKSGANGAGLIWAEQVFDSKIHICQSQDSGKIIKGVDGLISNILGQILAVVSADCVPILLFDQKNKAVAALHGSRSSLIRGIVRRTISKMVLNFQSQPEEILVGIGPHIRKCHYWLKEKALQELKDTKFKKYIRYRKIRMGALIYPNEARRVEQACVIRVPYFDLTKIAFDELLGSGIKRKNIEDCKTCTFCQFEKYFSARRKEQNPKIYPEKNPRFASFIGLKSPQILKLSGENFDFLIKRMIESLQEGKVIVLPTDTVYGLVADATNKKAVEKLFKIKKRKPKKPVPIFAKDIKMAKRLAYINKNQEKFIKKVWFTRPNFWNSYPKQRKLVKIAPKIWEGKGKVTVVLKRKRGQKIYGVEKKTIALRIPNCRFLNILLKKINLPLTGTSANISGEPPSTKINEILKQFQNQKYQPDLIIDAGNLPKSRPSKIIDLTRKEAKVLRK